MILNEKYREAENKDFYLIANGDWFRKNYQKEYKADTKKEKMNQN